MANDVNKINQLQEALLGSFETYYNEMIKKNQYDITVDATIIDVSQKPDGIYRVKTTGAEFEAYATAGSYYKNDIVLVQIPNGDYKNPKFILGRKADVETNKIFAFKLPFDDFINLMDLEGNVESTTYGTYWANWPETTTAQYDLLNTRIWHWESDGEATIGNTRLGITADWQTFLGQYFPIRGSYGLRIIVKGITSSTEITEASEIEREYYFTNVDMYGNPYAYATPFAQQKVLDVSDFLKINDVSIYFYQDFNFADNMNIPIGYEDKNASYPFVPSNIIFNKLKVYLGVCAEDLTDESTFLYSYQPLSYTSEEEVIYNTELNEAETIFTCKEEKIALFTWVHYESDGTYSVIKDPTDLSIQRNKAGKKTHIFWYRYDYKATPEDNVWDVTTHNHTELKQDWDDSQNNVNYESPMERYAGPHWTFIPAATDDFAFVFTPRGNKSREKFKVVVQHDGTHTTSAELEFKNTRDIEAEILAGAKNDAVIIKTFKLSKIKNNANQLTDQYEASEDGSINSFHIYDENNKILVNDDGDRFDKNYYYLQIHARDEETNSYQMLTTVAENGTSTGTSIAWALPRSYTMIKTTEEVDINDAKYFDIDPIAEPIRFKNFHNATIKFTIQSVFNNRYLDNTVGAIIGQNGKDYHIEKNLMFGRAEGLGHEFLPIIEIVEPVGGTYLFTGESNEFQIACAVYNKDGSLYENPNLLTFTWRELSGQCNFYHYNENKEKINGYKLGKYEGQNAGYAKKYAGYRGNVLSGSITIPEDGQAKPPIFEVTVTGAASYPLVVRKGFMVCNSAEHKQQRDISIPSRIEFKSDGSNPIFYSDFFEVAKLISKDTDIYADYDIEYPEWKINNNKIFSLQSIITPRETIEYNENNEIITADRGYKRYKLIFNNEYNPQWMDSYLDTDKYTYIYYTYLNSNGSETYLAQALAFDRNYYASSLVNDWDGTSLTWDEENGAILSTMIAAGMKDNNNKFTGVMMGDWHAKGDESLDTPGLYGYNKGAQTFGFKIDGTGFIGASGKGRIEFDGTEALISNADRSCYINLNPVNLSSRLTDIKNQSFSENFIYCKVNKTTNAFDSISNSIAGRTSWAKKYFEDNNNDYFIVDPNYGVLTTGGIVAKYGALGNWMISNEGLYQKTDSTYMYLGFDETDITRARSWGETKAALISSRKIYEDLYNNKIQKENEQAAINAQLQSAKDSYENEKAIINEEITNNEISLQQVNNEILTLNNANQTLAEEIQELENHIIDLQANIRTAANTIDNKRLEIDNYNTLIDKQLEIISSSNNAYAEQLVVIQNQQQQVDDLKNQKDGFLALLNQYKTEFSLLLEDKNTYISAIEVANQKIRELQTQNQQNNQKILENQEKIKEYKRELDSAEEGFDGSELEAAIAALENEIIELENSIVLNEETIIYNNSIISTYTEALSETGLKIDTLKTNIIILRNNFDILYTDIDSLNNIIEDTGIVLQSGILSDEEIQSANVPSQYATNINQQTDSQLYIQTEILIIEKQESYLNNILVQLNTLLNNRKEIIEDTTGNEEIVAANRLITQYNNAIVALEKEINNPNYQQNNEPAGLQQQIIIYQQQIQETQNIINNKKIEQEKNKIKLNDWQEKFAEYTNIIFALNNSLNQLDVNINNLEQQVKTIKNELDNIMTDMINEKNKINENNESIENAIQQLQINYHYNAPSLADKDTVEAINVVISEAVAAIDYIVFNYSTRYAIYISSAEPNILNADGSYSMVLPYFSVDWNGEMFARKGKIANTWVINDYALTYKKNNDILYLGSEEYVSNNMKTEAESYIPKGRALKAGQTRLYTAEEEAAAKAEGRTDTINDDTCWAISASDCYYLNDETKNPGGLYPINFGVSLSGKLYAQLGTIGGWKITNSTLESPLFDIDGKNNLNSIIFDALHGKIEFSNGSFIVDGAKGEVYLGLKYSDGVGIGKVYLSDYLLSGRTRSDVVATGQLASSKTDTRSSQGIGSYDRNNGWGGSSSGSLSVSVGTSTWLFQTDYKILTPNFFQIIDKTQTTRDVGVVLATGIKATPSSSGYSNTSENAILFYPTIDGATLGTTSLKWNLIANTISASLIDAGGINGTKVYMDKELVATEKAMYNALNDLWNALDSTDSSASSAGRAAKAAMNKANEAIEAVKRLTETIIEDLNTLNSALKNHHHDFSGSGSGSVSIPGHSHSHTVNVNGSYKSTSTYSGSSSSRTVTISISGTTGRSDMSGW